MPTITKDSTLKSLKEHETYYFPGSDLTVIVQNCAFCVPSVFFTRESCDFLERLTEGDSKKNGQEKSRASETGNSSTTHTIVIQAEEKVSPDDFAKLCWIFFNPTFSIYNETLDTWKVILRLANQWHFTEVKKLVFRELESPGKFDMSLVERIVLYRQYDADMSYLEPLYAELLNRPEPLTLEEAEVLQLRTTIMISGARERLRATLDKSLSIAAPLPPTLKDTVLQMVRCVFSGAPAPSLNGKVACNSNPALTTSSSVSAPLGGLSMLSSNNGSDADVEKESSVVPENDAFEQKLSRKDRKKLKGVGIYDFYAANTDA